ncbi:glycosyltransferase family A protein [Parvibaculum sp.]|uniref:glycosyltransferase family 2 protein n=1 Tax=Parvibaculum sp. TaxID=2024848 RepID=UPI002C35396B|nr:glycosyltransferase family A protein [Parvibaculum sp.]HUD52692.1 glycosyltransferase family A protein [Parvibaculum sp.]
MSEAYSVVIPAYNAGETIEDALRSIVSQNIAPTVVIVVDDGSTDDTGARASAFDARVEVIRQENQGCGAATNRGLVAVATPLVAFLDSDDLWLPGKAERQLALLDARPGLAGVFARGQIFKGPVSAPVLGPVADLWSRTTLMMRSGAARAIGPMIDPPGGRGDTIDWIARGREIGLAFELMEEVLSMRRIRPGSLSYGRDAEKDRGYLLMVKRALERKRAIALSKQTGDGDE